MENDATKMDIGAYDAVSLALERLTGVQHTLEIAKTAGIVSELLVSPEMLGMLGDAIEASISQIVSAMNVDIENVANPNP